MFSRIKKAYTSIPLQLSKVYQSYPVELALIVYCYVTMMLKVEDTVKNTDHLVLVPIFLAIAYFFNHLFKEKEGGKKWIYWLCWIPIIPLSFLESLHDWSRSPEGIIAMFVLSPLVILLSRRRYANSTFIGEIINYILCFVTSAFISAIIQGLFVAIYFSIDYIFDLNIDEGVRMKVMQYSSFTTFFLIAPIWYLATLSRTIEKIPSGSSFTDTLLNYIITPALLIYTTILYVYFGKIIVIWELPNGGIANLVFAFMLLAMATKALQPFIRKRKYEWFFDRFSLISVPALTMFWIGTIRRIEEYGLTEWRIYLTISGVIMTVCSVLFLLKRSGRYAHVVITAFFMFSIVAFIPYFSPERMSVNSQLSRIIKLANEVEMLDNKGHFKAVNKKLNDSIRLNNYNKIYESISYIEHHHSQEKLAVLGIKTADDYLKLFEENYSKYVRYGSIDEDFNHKTVYVRIEHGALINDTQGYNTLYIPNESYSDSIHTINEKYTEGVLTIKRGNRIIFTMNGKELVENILQQAGYSFQNSFTEEDIKILSKKGLVYRTDKLLISLTDFRFRNEENIVVEDLNVNFLMLKE